MRIFGKFLIIWGALLPLLALPAMNGFHPQLGLLGSLPEMHAYFLHERLSFGTILTVGLLMIGAGLTALILPEPSASDARGGP